MNQNVQNQSKQKIKLKNNNGLYKIQDQQVNINQDKIDALNQFLIDENIDILCLQEHKCIQDEPRDQQQKIENILGDTELLENYYIVADCCVRNKGFVKYYGHAGTLIAIKDDNKIEKEIRLNDQEKWVLEENLLQDGRIQFLLYENDNQKLLIINLYQQVLNLYDKNFLDIFSKSEKEKLINDCRQNIEYDLRNLPYYKTNDDFKTQFEQQLKECYEKEYEADDQIVDLKQKMFEVFIDYAKKSRKQETNTKNFLQELQNVYDMVINKYFSVFLDQYIYKLKNIIRCEYDNIQNINFQNIVTINYDQEQNKKGKIEKQKEFLDYLKQFKEVVGSDNYDEFRNYIESKFNQHVNSILDINDINDYQKYQLILNDINNYQKTIQNFLFDNKKENYKEYFISNDKEQQQQIIKILYEEIICQYLRDNKEKCWKQKVEDVYQVLFKLIDYIKSKLDKNGIKIDHVLLCGDLNQQQINSIEQVQLENGIMINWDSLDENKKQSVIDQLKKSELVNTFYLSQGKDNTKFERPISQNGNQYYGNVFRDYINRRKREILDYILTYNKDDTNIEFKWKLYYAAKHGLQNANDNHAPLCLTITYNKEKTEDEQQKSIIVEKNQQK